MARNGGLSNETYMNMMSDESDELAESDESDDESTRNWKRVIHKQTTKVLGAGGWQSRTEKGK